MDEFIVSENFKIEHIEKVSPSKTAWTDYEPIKSKKAKFCDETDVEEVSDVRVTRTEHKPYQLDREKFVCQKGSTQLEFPNNNFICSELMKLQSIYENENDIGRKIAYLKAISAIKCYPKEIET